MGKPKSSSVKLYGFVSKDAELQYLDNGSPKVTFNMAVNFFNKWKKEEEQKTTSWVKVTVLGDNAEDVVSVAAKGAFILVEGRLTDVGVYKDAPQMYVIADSVSKEQLPSKGD